MWLPLYDRKLWFHAILPAINAHSIIVQNGKQHVPIYIAYRMDNLREFTPLIHKIKYEP